MIGALTRAVLKRRSAMDLGRGPRPPGRLLDAPPPAESFAGTGPRRAVPLASSAAVDQPRVSSSSARLSPLGKESKGNLLLDETHRGEPGHRASTRRESESAVRRFGERPPGVGPRGSLGLPLGWHPNSVRLAPVRRTNSPADAWKLSCQNLHTSTLKRLLRAVSIMGNEGMSQEFHLSARARPDPPTELSGKWGLG